MEISRNQEDITSKSHVELTLLSIIDFDFDF